MDNKDYNDLKGFPSFQWSVFVEGGKDQFVVRGNDWTQFVIDVTAVKTEYFNHKPTATQEQTGYQTTTEAKKFGGVKYVCNTCGAEATLQEGINKNGNPYKLVKCSEDFKHNTFL
jgi:hypothetical protein